MSTQIQVLPKSGITIGTTPITSGTVGRVLFEGAGNVAQEDSSFFWDNTNKRLGIGKSPEATSAKTVIAITDGTANTNHYLTLRNLAAGFGSWGFAKSGSNDLAITYETNTDAPALGTSLRFYYGGTSAFASSLSVGTLTAPAARLDVRAQGALSTDIAFRIRNSADTVNLMSVAGNGQMIFNGNGILFNGNHGSTIDLNTSFYDNSGFRIGLDDYGNNTVIMTNRLQSNKINRLDNLYDGTLLYYGAYQGFVMNTKTSQFSAAYTSYLSHSTSKFVIGSTIAEARLDVKAQGALSTDIAFRVRNSADTFDLLNINGIGLISGRSDGAGGFNMNYQGTLNTTVQLGFQNGNPYLRVGNSNASNNSFNVYTSADNREYLAGLIGKATLAIGANPFAGTIKPNEANTNTLYVFNGTAPALSATDSFNLYSADITAGNAAPHFRTENGSVVKLYQETTAIASAALVSNAGTNLTNTDTFDGYTMQQVVKALRNCGILA